MQVLISCTNVTAVKRMTNTIKDKSLGSKMGMPLIKLLSGYRKAGDAEDANPHASYIWDVDDIPPNPHAAIALLFDEDSVMPTVRRQGQRRQTNSSFPTVPRCSKRCSRSWRIQTRIWT